MALLWLALFLTPASCALRTDPDGHGLNLRVVSTDPNSPIKNFTMDGRRKRLSWDVTGNVSEITCFINSDSLIKAKNNRYCQFEVLPKCQPSNYSVNVTMPDGESFCTWLQYPQQEGSPGAAAQHLKCQVYDVDFLTCRWEVGREAPGDVQYHLYLEDMMTDEKWACPRYTANGMGTNIQCQFSDVSGFVDSHYRFLVNATSKDSRVLCSERMEYLSDIENFSPPNMTVNCNKTHAVMEWRMLSHFRKSFKYDLEIQKGTDGPYLYEKLGKNSFILNNPGTYTVRIRALVLFQNVGQWSAPQRLVCDHEEGARLPVWLTPSVIVLATLLIVGSALLLCKRYAVLHKLFPPIPHLKDPIGDNLHNEKVMAWESDRASQEECPVAKVQVLGEK